MQLEDAAKAAGKGKWAAEGTNDHVRDVKWVVENPRNFVDSHHGKPIDGKFFCLFSLSFFQRVCERL